MSILRIVEEQADRNKDGVTTPGELFRWTAFLCVGLLFLLQAVYIGACLLFNVELGRAWAWWIDTWAGLTLLLCAGGGIGFFIWRMVHPEKSEKQAIAEIRHQRKMQGIELEKARLELELQRGIGHHEPNTEYSQGEIDHAVRLLLTRAYSGQPWTRDHCVKNSIMKKKIWDKANELMLSRKIRVGKNLKPETFTDAWGKYLDGHDKPQTRLWKDGLVDTK